jgi:hypothetical protein
MAGIRPSVLATAIISSFGGTQTIEQLSMTSSSSLTDRVDWRRCNAVEPEEIQRPPVDVGRPSLVGDFARFCQRLFERYSLYFAALHIRNSAPCLILPSLIY